MIWLVPASSSRASLCACVFACARAVPHAIANAPRIGRTAPVSESSPANSRYSSAAAGICPLAARIPSAIGRNKAARFLGQVGGREVDGDAPYRKVEAAVRERGAHALPAFTHFEIGQADDGKRRQPVGKMDFYGDFGRAASSRRAAAHHGKRHGILRKGRMRKRCACCAPCMRQAGERRMPLYGSIAITLRIACGDAAVNCTQECAGK